MLTKAIKDYVAYETAKNQSCAPCTLIDRKAIPYKRKFKHLFDPTTGRYANDISSANHLDPRQRLNLPRARLQGKLDRTRVPVNQMRPTLFVR